MANLPTTFRNTTAITARKLDVPDADFDGGCNNAGGAPGIGVATDNPGLDESLPNWTLEDQFEAARDPQVSQVIGGNGYTDQSTEYPLSGGVPGNGSDQAEFIVQVTNPVYPNEAGTVTVVDTMGLVSLATGWEVTGI